MLIFMIIIRVKILPSVINFNILFPIKTSVTSSQEISIDEEHK